MERHPKARQLVGHAQKKAAAAVKKFWDDMTPEERADFVHRRAVKQWEKNGGKHPVRGTPYPKPRRKEAK